MPDYGIYNVIHADANVNSSARLGSHVVIDADASVDSEAVIESGAHVGSGAKIGAAVRIGANATIVDGIALGSRAEVRAGSVVTRSVPAAAIVEGNPAVIIGYADTDRLTGSASKSSGGPDQSAIESTSVAGVTIHTFPIVTDLRGDLTVGEFERQIPFTPLRYFMVLGVPTREIRGEHAHRECHQFLSCIRGSCSVVADDGKRRVEVTLDAPNRGIYLPPMTWGIQYKYSADALLLVFASHYYSNADYIRDYATFLAMTNEGTDGAR